MSRLAVVLFNLGGPDEPGAVRPFLFNLFKDPAIIRLPGLLRYFLAWLIAMRRAPVAKAIYSQMGGASPIRANTEAQARELETRLRARGLDARTFVAMRYWHPFAAEAAAAVATFAPERVVLLPLYPQYSTTTTASSLRDWEKAATAAGIGAETRAICCYPAARGFVEAVVNLVRVQLAGWSGGRPRFLFSAHGLPKKVIRKGDPYQWQVERTAAAIAGALGLADGEWVICYQSRVGPLEWIGPSTEEEIRRAGRDRVPVFVVPIAFVSEHSETLVELDIEYRRVAEEAGVPAYERIPAVGAHASFIAGLVELVEASLEHVAPIAPGDGTRLCPEAHGRCAFVPAAEAVR